MSGTISPYQIAGGLALQPGGNPILGSAGGALGLGLAYQQSYDSALQANQANYNNILGGYQNVLGGLQQGVANVGTGYTNLMSGINNTLGANYGVPGVNNQWGVAAPAASAIQKLYSAQTGQQFDANGNPIGKPTGGSIAQDLANRGLGNTTAFQDANRGAFTDYGNAIGALGAQLGQTYAGYQNNVGQAYLQQQQAGNAMIANQGDSQLGFMNSVQIPYPDANSYANILYQQGQASQAAAQQAQQLQIFKMGLGRGGGSSGGGVGTPQMPRGGTYGSGGGGFASGGPGSSVNYGLAYMGGATTPINYGYQSPGGSSYNPSAGSFGNMAGDFGFAGQASPWGDTAGTEAEGAGIEY